MINLNEILRELYDRKLVLDRTIRELEKMQQTGRTASFLKCPKPHRSRKSMGETERQEVAARMKRYWAGRRKTQQTAG